MENTVWNNQFWCVVRQVLPMFFQTPHFPNCSVTASLLSPGHLWIKDAKETTKPCTPKQIYGGFLKWWYPTTIGFPTKNDHFGVFWGYHHLRKHPYIAGKLLDASQFFFGTSGRNSKGIVRVTEGQARWAGRIANWGQFVLDFCHCHGHGGLHWAILKGQKTDQKMNFKPRNSYCWFTIHNNNNSHLAGWLRMTKKLETDGRHDYSCKTWIVFCIQPQ